MCVWGKRARFYMCGGGQAGPQARRGTAAAAAGAGGPGPMAGPARDLDSNPRATVTVTGPDRRDRDRRDGPATALIITMTDSQGPVTGTVQVRPGRRRQPDSHGVTARARPPAGHGDRPTVGP